MIENKWHKKEKPMLTMSGLGGGLFQQVLASASEPIYVDDVFSTFLWEGNSTNSRAIANGIDLSGKGGLTWIKLRSGTDNHILYDTERGGSNFLSSDLTAAENSNDGLTFNSNGFTIAVNSQAYTNANGSDYCSWTFRKCPKFFDIVTFSGNSTAGREISHSLGSTPGMVIVKRRDAASSKWAVWHTSYGDNNRLYLNETSAGSPNQTNHIRTASSTTFTVGADYDVNVSGGTYVAYIFGNNDDSFGEDSDEAVIKCGGYTGAGTGLSVNVGFEPQWLMIKKADTTDDWHIFDNMRGVVSGGSDTPLKANLSYNESTAGVGEYISFTPTGFQVDSSSNPVGSNGSNYIYMAIRRPHKPPENATDVFDVFSDTGSNDTILRPGTSGSSVTDIAVIKRNGDNRNPFIGFRMLGQRSMALHTDAAAGTGPLGSTNAWDHMQGMELERDDNTNWPGATFYNYFFSRAPGCMDVVTYKGNSTHNTQISHNLGVTPEFMYIKAHDSSVQAQHVAFVNLGSRYVGQFNSNSAFGGPNANQFGDGNDDIYPTASNFTLGDDVTVNNSSKNYVAWLFSSLDGISKVGTYTGTGSQLNIDCGFTGNARLVIIRSLTGGGHWMWFDTVQGIVSGNDQHWRSNTTGDPSSSTDYIDPYTGGFSVPPSDSNANASGTTYLFIAFA